MFLELGEGGSPENGSNWYLEPIPDALRWLRDSRLPNGQWARYYEIATNTPLYYDRGRKRVPSFDQLGRERQTGYAYHVTIDINALTERYNAITRLGRAAYLKQENQPDSDEAKRNRLQQLEEQVSRIIGVQHTSGSWITTERFRSKFGPGKPWDGMYEEEQRITGKVFLTHVRTLCDYIELSRD